MPSIYYLITNRNRIIGFVPQLIPPFSQIGQPDNPHSLDSVANLEDMLVSLEGNQADLTHPKRVPIPSSEEDFWWNPRGFDENLYKVRPLLCRPSVGDLLWLMHQNGGCFPELIGSNILHGWKIYLPAPSKGCQLNPKRRLIDTL